MQTRTLFPILTIAAAGPLFIGCGAHDRFFVETDSGMPHPNDGSSGSDAPRDQSVAADQQSEPGVNGDGANVSDALQPDASSDARADAASDRRADSTPDSALPDGPSGDTVAGDAVDDTVVDDIVSDTVNDTAVNDTWVGDTAVGDSAPDGPVDSGGIPDVNPDSVDCSTASPPRITPSGSAGVCPGKTVTLTSSSATSYVWSTTATTQSIDVGAAGSYTVTTTDARGCMLTSLPTVVSVYPAPPTPTISPSGPTRFCNGGSVTLSTNSAASYLWSTGATTQSILVTASNAYTVTTTDANGCGATSAPVTVTVVMPTTGTRSYTYTGAADTFVVPECVTTLNVDAYGAQGGASNAAGLGGYGGEISANLSVTPGAVLQILVGGAGNLCSTDNTGGFNGGGVANCTGYPNGTTTLYSATGGGATDVRVSPYTLDDRVIVAGGGGGAGYNCLTTEDSGGVGGGYIGGKYPTMCGGQPDSAGSGGTQAGGGIGGTYPSYGYAGTGMYGVGGSGVSTGGSAASEGGGGGGGYFGGGGGCWVGGGGGSDYLRPAVATLTSQAPGTNAGNGILILSYP